METVRFREAESSAQYPRASRRWAAASGMPVSQLQRRASSPTPGKGQVGPGPKPGGGRQGWRRGASLTHKPSAGQRVPGKPTAAALDGFLHGHFFFFFNEDCVFSEAALPSWVESLGQKEALVGVLALLLCFTLQEIEAQSRKPRAQVGGWLLKNAKEILQNRAEKAWQVRKSA